MTGNFLICSTLNHQVSSRAHKYTIQLHTMSTNKQSSFIHTFATVSFHKPLSFVLFSILITLSCSQCRSTKLKVHQVQITKYQLPCIDLLIKHLNPGQYQSVSLLNWPSLNQFISVIQQCHSLIWQCLHLPMVLDSSPWMSDRLNLSTLDKPLLQPI